SQLWPAGRRARRVAAHRRAPGARTLGRTRTEGARCAVYADDRAGARLSTTDRPVLAIVGGAGCALDHRTRRIDAATGVGSVVQVEVARLSPLRWDNTARHNVANSRRTRNPHGRPVHRPGIAPTRRPDAADRPTTRHILVPGQQRDRN